MIRLLLAMLITTLVGYGCSPIIPKALLEQVNRTITFEALKKNPLAYEGQMVLLAGVIVKTTNTPTGATLEVYQTEMDWEDRPIHTDISKGRFLVDYGDFLDPEIYSKKRQITVAGKVLGVKSILLGEMEYPYPVIGAEAIHLWKKTKPLPYDPYPWYPIGAPWGPWGFVGPWYVPYWYY
ncbi:MAG: Slp family lipoprotein [Deltaproteobacteria bacterium]|nr:Slp family lipoprotein [Deltaproteobacteria bacterium]